MFALLVARGRLVFSHAWGTNCLARQITLFIHLLRILGEDTPLTLSELLDETHQLDADSKTKYWLEQEALRSNPKISASMMRQGGETTYMYKPPFQIMNKKALLKLLKQYSINRFTVNTIG